MKPGVNAPEFHAEEDGEDDSDDDVSDPPFRISGGSAVFHSYRCLLLIKTLVITSGVQLKRPHPIVAATIGDHSVEAVSEICWGCEWEGLEKRGCE